MAEATDITMDALRAENAALTKEIEEQQKNLQLAGSFGKELLDANNDLNHQLTSITQEYAARIEKLEQEKYSLQMKLDQKVHMEGSLDDIITSLKTAVKKQKQLHQDFIDGEHADRVNILKAKVQELQAETERLQALNKQQEEKYSKLQDLNNNLREQLESQTERLNETSSDELAALHAEINRLMEQKHLLEAELKGIKSDHNNKEMLFSKMKADIESKTNELEEAECKSTSYYNALEKCREEVKELKMELEQALMESQDKKKKGNSLFAEVEDRRIVAEKELVTLKVKYNTLEKQLEATQGQFHRLKVQFAAGLMMSNGRVDEKYVKSLQIQLATANNHQATLLDKLQKYQAKEEAAATEAKALPAAELDGNIMHMHQFMQAKLQKKDDEIKKLQDQSHADRMCLLVKSEDLRMIESKHHEAEKQGEGLRAQLIKAELQIEELRLKYEPETVKFKPVVKKYRTEAIPMGNTANTQKEAGDRTSKENVDTVAKDEAPKPKKAKMSIKQIQDIMKKVPKKTSDATGSTRR